jgi:4-amino-4-deoxy-L-arabinose transferase-like glycosyltransferase
VKHRVALFTALALLTALRLCLLGQMELSPDEAYYHLWSQHPDLAYYSKGPGVALAIGAGTALWGPTEFGIRFFSPLLALGTSLLVYFLARKMYGESVACWTVLTANCLPIFNVGSLVMTIDPLSVFFWTAALCTLWLALAEQTRFTLWWPATGLMIGLGFLCKYTNALQLLSAILFLAVTPRFRQEFRKPGFYSMLALFALCMLPPVIWNQRHEWITAFHLQSRGGLDRPMGFHPLEWLTFLGSHFGVYSPLLFAGVLMALWWAAPKHRTSLKTRFLLWLGLPLLVLYFILAINEAGEANWTGPAMISLLILSTALWHERASTAAWVRWFAVAALIVGMLFSAAVLHSDLIRAAGIQFPYERDPSARLRGWRTTAAAVHAVRTEFERQLGQPVFLIANRYQTAASLAFYLPEKRTEGPGHPPVYLPESQFIENQFSFWPRYEQFIDAPAPATPPADADYFTEQAGVNPFMGRTALYITDRIEERPPTTIKGGFERWELIRLLEIERRGLKLREIRIFACYDYRSMPL